MLNSSFNNEIFERRDNSCLDLVVPSFLLSILVWMFLSDLELDNHVTF